MGILKGVADEFFPSYLWTNYESISRGIGQINSKNKIAKAVPKDFFEQISKDITEEISKWISGEVINGFFSISKKKTVGGIVIRILNRIGESI